MQQELHSQDALSPGAAAALESALSALTAGGGSTIKLPTVALNTYDRSSITSLIDGVLGGPGSIIPKPNLLGEIPVGALTAASALLSLRKTLSADVKKLNKAQADVASKQRALFEAQSTFPAGSPEIIAAEASYQSAATDPQLKALTAKIETAKTQFGSSITQTVAEATPETTEINPFSEIEQAVGLASVQAVNTPSATEGIYDPWSVNNNETVLLDQLVSVDQSLYQDNTYTNIYSTITQPPAPIVDTPEDDIVESIVSGGPKFGPLKPPGYVPLQPTDGQGGVGQDVYTWWGYER